jgi:hypothetical protein
MKIGLLYNFFRFDGGHIALDIIYEALKRAARKDADFEVIDFSKKYEKRQNFFIDDICPDIGEWRKYQSEKADLSQWKIQPEIFETDIIIGFELSPALCTLLSKKNVRYINFYNHAVRFLPDILWSIGSNDIAISNKIRKWNYDFEDIEKYVDQLKMDFLQTRVIQEKFFIDGTTVIFAQAMEDASGLVDGISKNLYDYREEIKQLTQKSKDIVIVPHPYEKNIMPLIGLLAYLGRGKISKFNSYALLCSEKVKDVITLSSSLGVESRFFDKKVHFIIGEALREGGSLVPSGLSLYTIGQEIFHKDFWENILFNKAYSKAYVFEKENLVRNILGSWALNKNHCDEKFIIGSINEEIRTKAAGLGIRGIDLSHLVKIDFRDGAADYLYWSKGLSGKEADGRWSDGHCVELELPDIGKGEGHYCFRIRSYGNEMVRQQRLTVYINDEKIGSVLLEGNSLYKLLIPCKHQGNRLRFKFYLPDATSPSKIVGYDYRLLGIKFIQCEHKMEFIEKMQIQKLETKTELEKMKETIINLERENESLKETMLSVLNSKPWRLYQSLGRVYRNFRQDFSLSGVLKKNIKSRLLFAKEKINKNPRLKKCVMKSLKYFPKLEHRLKMIGKVPVQIQAKNRYIPYFSPSAKKIYEQIK